MLESMRNHTQGWIAKVILGAIILSFALWGVGDYFTGNQVEAVAKVDGEAIFDVEFASTYQRQLGTYANMLGDQFTKEMAQQLGVKNETLQTMINRKLMLMEANNMGLVSPDQAVLATIQSTQAFQEPNQGFSTARYQGLIRQMGFASPRDYENYLRQNILIDTLQKAITESAAVSDEEVKKRFKSNFEKRVLAALIVNPESLKKGIKVSDNEARDWYEAHEAMYQSPLKVELQIVEIDSKNLKANITVSDADIEDAYLARQSEFGTPEKRRAAHILVRVARDASVDIKQAAMDKIVAAKKRIADGESFADVAKDVSDDVTSSDGGNVGTFGRGAMVPEFEAAVFDALQVGEVSDVVKTQFGYHLIQLNEVQEADVKPLAKVKGVLRDELMNEKAAEMAYQLSEDLNNALGMEDSLVAAANVVDLPVVELGALSQENVLANPLFSVSDELRKKAFSMQPGDVIEIVEVDNGHFVALEVKQRIEPSTMAFEDVVKRVYDDVRNDLAVSKAKTIANDILEAAKAGGNINTLAQKFSQPKYTSKAVRSNGEGDDAIWLSAVLAPSFRAPASAWVETAIPTSEGLAVVFVQKVQEADDALFASEADKVRQDAIKAKGAVRFASWMASVRDRHDIEINERVLSRF